MHPLAIVLRSPLFSRDHILWLSIHNKTFCRATAHNRCLPSTCLVYSQGVAFCCNCNCVSAVVLFLRRVAFHHRYCEYYRSRANLYCDTYAAEHLCCVGHLVRHALPSCQLTSCYRISDVSAQFRVLAAHVRWFTSSTSMVQAILK